MSSALLTILLCLSMGLGFGKFRMPTDAPVDRLTRNLEAYVQAHPKDAQGHYTLARIHYLAFALRSETVPQEPGEPPTIGNRFNPGKPNREPAGKISEEEALKHLIAAGAEIQIALQLDSKALFHLTAACILEDGAPLAPKAKRGATTGEWMERAVAEYLKAHELAWRVDSKLERQPLAGFHSLVSYEAGVSYLRMVKERGERSGEQAMAAKIEQHVKELSALPRMGITPIVMSLSPGIESLSGLLDPEVLTSFDLDGTGRDQRWPWLRPDTGLLVWDPQRKAVVTSGRQLFGSVTWWMFWDNGYDALAALDDDRDGWLAGRELEGLSLWFDRNQNGVSDPGEVVNVQDLGVEAIRVRADGRDGLSWRSSAGVRLRSGLYLPTWDWVVTPVPASVGPLPIVTAAPGLSSSQ